jgi:hypothetical protein
MIIGRVYYFPNDTKSYAFYNIAINKRDMLELALEDNVNCYIIDFHIEMEKKPPATRLQKFRLIKAMFLRGVWDARK